MVNRRKYLDEIREFYDSDLVKVITGIRRSGKSIILEEIMDEISLRTDNIVYLNFERSSVMAECGSVPLLLNYVKEHRKEGKCYIFLDEIQEVEDWGYAVKDLRLGNNSVFVAGSNSKILSKKIKSLLSGRYISLRVRPLVYKEMVELGQELGKDKSVTDYLIYGGFPARFAFSEAGTRKYLEELRDTIVYNDLIRRYKIKKVVPFMKIVNFVMRNGSRILSARNIAAFVSRECETLSINTVLKYLDYLKEAYLIDEIPQYSSKAKKELAYYEKIYLSDVSFSSLLVDDGRYDLDHNLENIVYNELIYRGYSLKVFSNGNKKIDFRATKNGKVFYIQVAYSVLDQSAYEREMSAFKGLAPNDGMILITTDELDYSNGYVKHIKLKDFLLMDDL